MLQVLFFLSVLTVQASPVVEIEKALKNHGWGAVESDQKLSEAARALAERMGRSTQAANPSDAAGHLRFVLESNRITDAHVYPFTIRHRSSAELKEKLPVLLGRLERRHAPTHMGIGTYGYAGRLTTTILLVHRGVILDTALPLKANTGEWITVGGQLRSGYFKPRVMVAPPGGSAVRDRPAWTTNRRVDVNVYFDAGPGVYGLEIVADSQYGPVVLNNHRVYVDVARPELPTVKLSPRSPRQTPQASTDVMFEMINALRQRNGLPALRKHRQMGRIAHEYAQEMARRQKLAHGSPDTGTLATRLSGLGLPAIRIAENLAKAQDPRSALNAFLDSPGHKRNLLLPGLTDVGVGHAGEYYAIILVQLLEGATRQQLIPAPGAIQ